MTKRAWAFALLLSLALWAALIVLAVLFVIAAERAIGVH